MALITDSGLAGISTLLPYENDLLETADKERVEIQTKIEVATAEVRAQLEVELDRAGVGATSANATGYGMANVVVTDALHWWLHCHVLYLFYVECYGHQLNERFKAKKLHYADRAALAKETYLERGVGVAANPLPRPAVPTIFETPGSLAEGNYYVAVAWLGSNGRMSMLSPMTTFSTDGQHTVEISAGAVPSHAVGWHVFVGSNAENLVQQNIVPVGTGQTWVMTQPWDASGSKWGPGQVPDVYLQPQRVFLRG